VRPGIFSASYFIDRLEIEMCLLRAQCAVLARPTLNSGESNKHKTRTRTSTNTNDTEANVAGRRARACVARKSKSERE